VQEESRRSADGTQEENESKAGGEEEGHRRRAEGEQTLLHSEIFGVRSSYAGVEGGWDGMLGRVLEAGISTAIKGACLRLGAQVLNDFFQKMQITFFSSF